MSDPVGTDPVAPVLEVPVTSEDGPVTGVLLTDPVPDEIKPLLDPVMLPIEVELDQVNEEYVVAVPELPTSLDVAVIVDAVSTPLLEVPLPSRDDVGTLDGRPGVDVISVTEVRVDPPVVTTPLDGTVRVVSGEPDEVGGPREVLG